MSGEPEILGLDTDPLSERAAAPRPPAGSPPAITFSRKLYQRGLRTFSWQAEDPNGDALLFDVEYRAVGDERWRPLRAGLDEPVFAWDTATVPNGRYLLRVVARTPRATRPLSPSPARRTAPRSRWTTPRPRSRRRSIPAARVASASPCGTTRAPCASWRLSIDAGRWEEVHPVDGIADSLEESYEIPLPAAKGRAPHRRPAGDRPPRQRRHRPRGRPVGRSPWTSCSSAPARSGICSSCGAPSRRCARRDTACASSRPRARPGVLGPGRRSRRSSPGTAPRSRPLLAGSGREGPLDAALGAADAVVAFTRSEPVIERLGAGRASARPRPDAPASGPHALSGWRGPWSPCGSTPGPTRRCPPRLHRGRTARRRAIGLATCPTASSPFTPAAARPRRTGRRALRRGGAPAVRRPAVAPRPGPAEEESPPPADAVLARDWPLRALGAALARAGLFLGNDSGVAHLAAAVGRADARALRPHRSRAVGARGPRGRHAAPAGRLARRPRLSRRWSRPPRARSGPRRADLHPADQAVDAHRHRRPR